MGNPFKQMDIVALNALASNMDDKTLLSLSDSCEYFNSKICKDNTFWQRRLNEKYPLLSEIKEEEEIWKEFYLKMTYYISKLGILGIPYIPTKGYNPEEFYKNYKNNKYIFDEAMFYAAYEGNIEIVKLMIEKGATDFDWAILEAAEGGHMEIVKLMIENGATDFNTAMINAAEGGYMEIVKLMIEKGATDFDTAMNYAAIGGQMKIVEYLKQFVE
jgi:Ankyrin repeats (3 copies)